MSPPPTYQQVPPGYPSTPPKTSGLAITSLILGCASLLCSVFTGIPAAICGVIAMKKIKASNGTMGGHGLALAGLIIGVIMSVLAPVIAILAGIAMPAFSQVQANAKMSAATVKARSIHVTMIQHASENDGKLPATLDEMVPLLGGDDTLLEGPPPEKDKTFFTLVHPGEKLDDLPAQEPVLTSKVYGNTRKRIVVRADGSVETVRE